MHTRYLKRLLVLVIRLPTINLLHCRSNEPCRRCHDQYIYIYKARERELLISSDGVVVTPAVVKRKCFYQAFRALSFCV
jgi:hypothetical protein